MTLIISLPSTKCILYPQVFRHGARTPADTYPLDPHVNETYAPFGWGHLTNRGKSKLYELGMWMHDRYGSFLGDYQTDEVHAQATGVIRTQMSLQLVLAALYKPKDTLMEWSRELNWQPIPINYQPLVDDDFLLVRTCPRYAEAKSEVYKEAEVTRLHKKYANLMRELSRHTGRNVTSAEGVFDIYTTLLAEKEFGLRLPDWTKKFFPHKMQRLTDISYALNSRTEEMQRLKSGPFLKKMVHEMIMKTMNATSLAKRKLFIYCGHDVTLVSLLSSLNAWPVIFPDYALQAYFELHKGKDGEYFVQVFAKNGVDARLEKIVVPGCEFRCPIGQFVELVDKFTKVDLKEDCKPKVDSFTEPPASGPYKLNN